MSSPINRRTLIAGGCSALPLITVPRVLAAVKAETAVPPSVITQPPRQWGKDAAPDVFPDPDVLPIDDSFNRLIVRSAPIKRLGTGFLWAEGPAWSGEGQYLLFSDVQGDTQYRYIWGTDIIIPFRKPSFYSNGNCFDFQGRQLSCQHYFRRVVRWELDGSMTVIADRYDGKTLNAPNDICAHPDGSIWFTDPGAGAGLSEGHPDIAGGPQNPTGLYDPKLGDPGTGLGEAVRRELPTHTYRWDPDAKGSGGKLDVVVPGDRLRPNGICFSPDYKRVYIISGGIHVGDVAGGKVTGLRSFTECMVDGIYCHPDGMRVDRAGNVWASSNIVLGYSGVTVWNPDGKLIGRIRLPEGCANVCFGGPKRDHLFMTASQSLYMMKVGIQGAAPG
ncbi:MAG TPA: SMP-30/gluconolactonase/LRE family protein [Rhizomicrobium sp.]|nr:SMP-30/gluconolactonase/LRE family protein [Rhizomicrobium sp.]